jgi:hypothetical protein
LRTLAVMLKAGSRMSGIFLQFCSGVIPHCHHEVYLFRISLNSSRRHRRILKLMASST